MRLTRMIASIAVGVTLLATGLQGVASAQDRPSLLDVPFTSVLGTPPAGYSYNTLQIMLDETTLPSASVQSRVESANAAVEKPGADRIALRLYEPDKVGRKSDSAQLQQADHLFLFVRTVVPTFTTSGVVTGCKGKASVKKNLDTTQTFKWSYSCKSLDQAMQQLAVPQPIRDALTAEFKDKGFKMSGQMTQ